MNRRDPVMLWLYFCCGMIFVMALLGAITRLTESGLSITSWDPIIGALPPMSNAAWDKAFADYQTIPQYQVFNRGMSLGEFKHIYFWEWLHRLWGRLIGVVFALPLLWFYFTQKISRGFSLKLLTIFALGGLQGFIGWFMVQSGLEVRTTVSPYRLALHLAFALLLYALLLWTALGRKNNTSFPTLRSSDRESSCAASAAQNSNARYCSRWIPAFAGMTPYVHGWIALSLLATTIVWGALVAGLRAGGAYNTWPLMDGSVLPDAAWSLTPAWLNVFANTALVQFVHRWLGPLTFATIVAWVARCWRGTDTNRKKWLFALGTMALVQVGLGIGTLLSHVQIAIAVTHQAGAITLLTLVLVNLRGFCGSRTNRR
jgi:heme a synthase